MPYLTPDDLATHMYLENMDEIVRENGDLITKAINAGVGLAKSGKMSNGDGQL